MSDSTAAVSQDLLRFLMTEKESPLLSVTRSSLVPGRGASGSSRMILCRPEIAISSRAPMKACGPPFPHAQGICSGVSSSANQIAVVLSGMPSAHHHPPTVGFLPSFAPASVAPVPLLSCQV